MESLESRGASILFLLTVLTRLFFLVLFAGVYSLLIRSLKKSSMLLTLSLSG